MKIAYLTSVYPAVSHTFVLREVHALRARGLEIGTFSVRRATGADILGAGAEAESKTTRWLLPGSIASYLRAFVWALSTRPSKLSGACLRAIAHRKLSLTERMKWLAYLAEAIQLAHWLALDGFEHLHCHFGNAGASTGLLAADICGIPFSMTCHGSELNEPERYCLTAKVEGAKFVVLVSKYGRARLMHSTPIELWHKFHVIRCGIPTVEAVPPPDTGATPQILCVARMSKEKGHPVLLEALSKLRRQDVKFFCTLVGDGPMRNAVEEHVKALALSDAVAFAGSQPPERVADYYRDANVVVLASFSEGVPVVLMEAMAHRRPVVATRVGGVPELVEHNVSGYIVSPGDADELADAIKKVISDPARAAEMGSNGAGAVYRGFSIPKSAEALEKLFRK